MEHVKGVPLNTFDPKQHSQEERLRVLSLCMEAEVTMMLYGVRNEDVAPRNVICSGRDLLADDLRVRIIDLGFVTILPLLGLGVPCESEPLPESPIEWFWYAYPYEMGEWLPDGWTRGPE